MDWRLLLLLIVALVLLAWPLGSWMAGVFDGRRCGLDRVLGPIERRIYGLLRTGPQAEMDWRTYARALLAFSFLGTLALYGVQRLQHVLPLAGDAPGPVAPDTAFNAAVSFVTNTNWQSYAGESTMTPLVQMVGFTVQNFVSAAAGIAVLLALVRGLTRTTAGTVGNFWVDLVRITLYVLLPLSLVLALILVSQGVVQSFGQPVCVQALAAGPGPTPPPSPPPLIPRGPVASQVAIKQLGTNGGGYFNANSAHPFENPTPLSNFVELLAILLLPAALCFSFGRLVHEPRQGRAIFAAMLALFLPLAIATMAAEASDTLQAHGLEAAAIAGPASGGGNLEGKEVRFGAEESALWATATTAASNGSVNSMLDSYTPLGGLVALFLIQLGEVVFGGVGSGLYGMLLFALVAVFVAGLMVGRTPEYLGKKIEAFEMKMAALAILVSPLLVLLGTAVSAVTAAGKTGVSNPGPHGFTQLLYAWSSAANNNGSAFAGLDATNAFWNTGLAVAMWFGRFLVALPVLAIAGSLAAKRPLARSPGTLPTYTPLFVVLLASVALLVGALTFLPALALGPIAEHLLLVH